MKTANRILTLAAGLAGGLLSQTLSAAPTLYGQLNLSIDQLDNGSDSALNISSNSSRLGVKGDIQIGGDIAGIYQIESELRADTAAPADNGVLASRDTFVGLQGKFGTLRIGRFDTPVKLIGRQVDLFKDQVGDARNLTRGANGSGTANTLARFDERPNNSLGYTTPELAGFKGNFQYSTNVDTAATATNDNDLISAAVNYAQGPLFVGLGYETTGFLSTTTPPAAGAAPSIIRLGAYYDWNAWRINALWQKVSGTTGANDEDVYGLGASFKHQAWLFKAQTYQLNAYAANKDATLLAVGTEYTLQKGVILYADYAAIDNDPGRGLTPFREGRSDNLTIATANNGDSASAISLGAIIKF